MYFEEPHYCDTPPSRVPEVCTCHFKHNKPIQFPTIGARAKIQKKLYAPLQWEGGDNGHKTPIYGIHNRSKNLCFWFSLYVYTSQCNRVNKGIEINFYRLHLFHVLPKLFSKNIILMPLPLKFLRFPNAQLILQRDMVPNLKSIMFNDNPDCASKNFHVPQAIKINIGRRMCPVSYWFIFYRLSLNA